MSVTDTSEKGLETLIMFYMTGVPKLWQTYKVMGKLRNPLFESTNLI